MTWSIINEKQYFPVACLVDLPDYALLLQKKKQKKKQRAGLGLEIPVMYQAKWKHGKALKWLEKAIEKMLLQADEIASQFKSERFF